jgi:hypothetical protein
MVHPASKLFLTGLTAYGFFASLEMMQYFKLGSVKREDTGKVFRKGELLVIFPLPRKLHPNRWVYY